MKKTRRFILTLENQQYETLRKFAYKQKKSIASVVREMVDDMVKQREIKRREFGR